MTDETPEPRSARVPLLAVPWLVGTGAVIAVWVAVLAVRTAGGLGETWAAAARATNDPEHARIERASGLSLELILSLQIEVPEDARLVLYSPYGGKEFELDAADPRGEPARQVRGLFERAKNLLYPHPRDVHFARDPDELLGKLAGRAPGTVFVLDGTLAPDPLAVGGRYTLLFENPPGKPRLRLWGWRGR